MLEKFKDALTSKLAMVIGGWAAILSVAILSVILSLGKAAFEDNTAQLKTYTEVNRQLAGDVKEFAESMLEFKILVSGVRESYFRDKLKNLYKQTYKMDNDPTDIKPIDVVYAVNFCGGELFDSYKSTLSGSELVSTNDSCERVSNWIKHN